jgi:acetyl esterase
MTKTFLTVIAMAFMASAGYSQENVPVLKANFDYVTIRWDNTLIQNSWHVTPAEKLDIYPTSAKRLIFYSDIDSIAFTVDPTVGQYNFIILLNGKDSAHTQVKYDAAAKMPEHPNAIDVKRAIEGQVKALNVPPTPIYKVENRAVWNGTDSIRIRIYYPKDGKHQRILYNIHGGAFVACDLETHDNISRILANKTQSIVVALDYRKPPEFPYPASLDDITTVLQWINKNAASLGGDKNNIVWVGDSGGGLQATALALKMQKTIVPRAIVLVNPAVDLRHYEHGSYAQVVQSYLRDKDPNDSLVSPIIARNFSFFPPTLIVTSERDGLKPQGVALYTSLTAAGVHAQMVDVPKMGHLAGYWAEGHANADLAIAEAVKFILAESPN